MTRNDPALKRYYKSIISWLPCSRKLKKHILNQIQDCVGSYLEQNPEADFPQLQAHFGDPQTIAAAYVENVGTAEILRGLRVRKRIFTAAIAILVILLVTWSSAVAWAALGEKKSSNGYIESKTISAAISSTFYDCKGVSWL